MKKLIVLLFASALILGSLAGCGKDAEETSLDSKHEPFPQFMDNASDEVKSAYVLASNHPEVLASVPCFCGCYNIDGHISNLDCFVDSMGSDQEVTGWDTMGLA